jgi:spermidine synthase
MNKPLKISTGWEWLAVIIVILTASLLTAPPARAAVVFDKFSAYHHIQVLDLRGIRTLSFNGSRETRMSLANPLQGHFEYTEYFHAPWIWNRDLKRVLMLGLGGGSTQRSFQHYYTNVLVESVELDPMVVKIAKNFFRVKESPRHKIRVADGRVFLKRTTNTYDAIIMDAYATSRYGSSLPPHLTTKEFFTLASGRMSTNGVLAYNVIGQLQGWRADTMGALYRTMQEVFPNVYLFPANDSMNVVIIATKSPVKFDAARVQREGAALMRTGQVKLPTFATRLRALRVAPPASFERSPVLTDDRAPVESLMRGTTDRER